MENGDGFARIVVAFDGSKDSVRAIKIACSLAKSHHSEFVVVHVYSSPMIAYGAGASLPVPDYKDLEDAAKQTASEVLSQGLRFASEAGVTAKGELLEAQSVVEALSDFAAATKTDLLVVGTRGMTGFKKLIVGSVSSGLVSHATCPVLVVR